MIEVIKHTLGFCGEHWHPNIFTVLAGSLGISPGINYIYFISLENNTINAKNKKIRRWSEK